MSTKTTFKRISLVAVVALGFGMLSGVANAAPTFNNAVGYTAPVSNATSQVVGGQVGLVILSGASDVTTNVVVSGVGSVVANSATLVGGAAATTSPATVNSSTPNFSFPGSSTSDTLTVTSQVAGAQTITATPVNGAGVPGAAVVYTITWGSAATLSAQYSTAFINTVNGTASTVDATVLAPTTAAGFAAAITVTLKDGTPAAFNGQSVSATISGPGVISIGSGSGVSPSYATGARAVSVTAATQAATNLSTINVYGDGTAGAATITITAGTLTFTKTVTFYGSASTATATQALHIAKANTQLGITPTSSYAAGSTVTSLAAVTGLVKDSAGNAVTGATVKVVSSNSSVIVAGTCVEETADAKGTYNCPVSGASGAASGATATVTFEAQDSTGAYTILATPLTFAIGGAVTSMALTTDATSYTPLAPITLTVTAKDASGNLTYDQDLSTGVVAGIVSSTGLGGTLLSPIKLINGVGTKTGAYAPSISGDFTISGTDALSTAGEAVSVSATVAGGDTASAVDAANAATDAANYAADAADAATTAAQEATAAAQAAQDSADAATAAVVALGLRVNVLMASVRAQLTSLSNLLVRIIKKTHA